MVLKKALAREIVAMYHGADAAKGAQRHFEVVHQERELPESITKLVLSGPTPIIDVLTQIGGVKDLGYAARPTNVKTPASITLKSWGHLRVNAHHATSRRKLLPSPLSPVIRLFNTREN